MKVCLLNDSFPPVIDGVANTVMNYARVLTELGDTAAVATPRYPGASYDAYPYEVIPYQSIDTSKLVHGYRAGNPFDRTAVRRMKEFQPDLIHTHCPVASCVLARILRNETEAPVVFTYHTKFDYDIARMVKAKPLQQGSIAFLIDNINACDEVWTVSRGAGENLKSLGFHGDYRVMQNGVDFPKGRVPAERVQALLGGYDLPEGVPCYLFVGRLMAYKGLPIIIDAMKKLSEKGLDYRCVFVGGGADAAAMQERVAAAGLALEVFADDDAAGAAGLLRQENSTLPGKVIFTGAVHDRENLRAWNTRADLFLFPSTYDTNGIVVREAAACGLASVLIRDSCAAEGITEGRNGYFIDEDAASMAALLEQLYSRREEVHAAGQHAMDEIYLSWDDAVRTARGRYAEILDLVANDELPVRHWEPSDSFLAMAEQFAGDGEPLFRSSRIRAEGMLGNYYNAKSTLTRSAHTLRDGMRKAAQGFYEAAKESATEIAQEFLGDGTQQPGQKNN